MPLYLLRHACVLAFAPLAVVAVRLNRLALSQSVPLSPCDVKPSTQDQPQQQFACEEFRKKEIRSWECQKKNELCEEWGTLQEWPHFLRKSMLHVEVITRADSFLAVPWREFKSADLRFYRGSRKACEDEPTANPMWFSSAHIAAYVYGKPSVCAYKLRSQHIGNNHSGAAKTLKLLDMSDPAALEFLKTQEMTQELMALGRKVESMPEGDDCAQKRKCKDCLRTPPPSSKCLHLGAILSLLGVASGPQCYWNEDDETCHKPGNISESRAVKNVEGCVPDKGKDLIELAYEVDRDNDGRDSLRRNSFNEVDARLASLLCNAVRHASEQKDGSDTFLHGYFAFPMVKGYQMLRRQPGQQDFPGEAMLCNAADWLELVGDIQNSEQLESTLAQETDGCETLKVELGGENTDCVE